MNVLIAYKSRKGANQEVAEYLGRQLDVEFQVTVADMNDVATSRGMTLFCWGRQFMRVCGFLKSSIF